MASVEPKYQGVKEKRKKERGDSKEKENFFHCCSLPLPPHPHSDTDTRVTFFMDSPSVKWELSYKIVYGLWGVSKGKRKEIWARGTTREREWRRKTFPLSSRALPALHMTEIPFPFPFERLPGLRWLDMHALPCVVTELGCYVLVSQLYLIWTISCSCGDDGYVVSNQLFDVCVFFTGIRKCRTYSDMWRTYQQNGWPSIVRGTASDWSMVFVSRRVVKMYYSEVAFQGTC